MKNAEKRQDFFLFLQQKLLVKQNKHVHYATPLMTYRSSLLAMSFDG